MNHTSKRAAFTLVELMVVIGIIALLVGILLPAVNAARRAAKVAASKSTISTIGTGLEQFKADARIGGMYPPSGPDFAKTNAIIQNPHGLVNKDRLSITGASLLVWAMAGADLMGTPGFPDNTGVDSWHDDMAPNAAYAVNANQPAYARSGPFVEISKMKFPELEPGVGYHIPTAKDPTFTLPSLCFLDTFDQPIIYMRAQKNTPNMLWPDPADPQNRPGVFHLTDNAYIVGLKANIAGFNRPGVDLGAGLEPASGLFHPMAQPGDPGMKGSFAYSIRNPKITAANRPYNEDSYILLSAGPDARFGTGDDIANFPVNQ